MECAFEVPVGMTPLSGLERWCIAVSLVKALAQMQYEAFVKSSLRITIFNFRFFVLPSEIARRLEAGLNLDAVWESLISSEERCFHAPFQTRETSQPSRQLSWICTSIITRKLPDGLNTILFVFPWPFGLSSGAVANTL